jgi:EAL domain-containing protein (putative c-di-GMP-specific phosphodiesterase class I)
VRTIAEGVETAGQAEQLVAAGCDIVQGYHYARPMTAADLDARLAEGSILTSAGRGGPHEVSA